MVKNPSTDKSAQKNYDWVAYIDADCQIRSETPALELLAVANKSLYMAKGFSGRINSGVMIVKNCEEVKELLKTIYSHCNENVPCADWGENGHVIYFASQWEGLKIIDQKWNNNADPELKDYIRHFSAGGPMRELYPATYIEKMIRLMQYVKNYLNRNKYLPRHQIPMMVEKLFNQVIAQNQF